MHYDPKAARLRAQFCGAANGLALALAICCSEFLAAESLLRAEGVHSARGLEWTAVYVMNAVEGAFLRDYPGMICGREMG